MNYRDKTIICAECFAEFIFSSGEQQFFASKGFRNEPRRCKECKARKGSDGKKATGIETQITCSSCQKLSSVPFKPTQGRAVYCRECFEAKRPASQ